jgi:hypothetical protein
MCGLRHCLSQTEDIALAVPIHSSPLRRGVLESSSASFSFSFAIDFSLSFSSSAVFTFSSSSFLCLFRFFFFFQVSQNGGLGFELGDYC